MPQTSTDLSGLTPSAGPRTPFPVLPLAALPALTTAQMREVDRLMVEDVGVSLVQMMENAGRSLADLAVARFDPATVTVLAGAGNNGGGGLAAARHLVNRGIAVRVALSQRARVGSVAESQLRAAVACGAILVDDPVLGGLVIDALVGYGLSGSLRGRAAELAEWALGQDAPVLALDAPSGLDTTTGMASPGAVRAAATLTLALPKVGLIEGDVGELYLADISVPRSVYAGLGIEVPALFDHGPILRLSRPSEAQAEASLAASVLAWQTPLDAARLIVRGATFAAVARIALVVGILLTAVNLGGAITRGRIGPWTALEAAANFLIPYVVSSLGVLSHTRIRSARRQS